MRYRHWVVALALAVFVSPAAGVKSLKALRPAPVETKADKLPEFAKMRLGSQGLVVALAQFQVPNVSFSGDGKIAGFAEGNSVRLVETETLKQVAHIPNLTKGKINPRFLTLSPDAKKLATSVGPGALVYDIANKKTLCEIKGPLHGASPFAFSPDGSRLAVITGRAKDHTAHVWDLTKGEELFELKGHEGPIACIGYSPDGKYIGTGSQDMNVRLWDAATGKMAKTLEGHRQSVNCLTFNADGKLLASNSTDGSIRIWNVAKGELETKIRAPYGLSLAFSPESKSIYQRDYMGLRCWDIGTGKEVNVESRVGTNGVSPNGQVAASSLLNSIRFWDLTKQEALGGTSGHTAPVTALSISADGTYVVSGDLSGVVVEWNLTAGKQELVVHEHQSMVNSLSWAPGKQEFYSSSPSERFVSRWDAKTGKETGRFKINVHQVVTASNLSPDGTQLAVAGSDQMIHLYDPTGKQTKQFVAGQLSFVTFSADGKNLVGFSTDNAIKVWDLDGKEVHQINGQNLSAARSLSADGSVAAARNGAKIRIWDLNSCKEVRSWEDSHANQANPIMLSPDGRVLAASCADGTIKLYETLTGFVRRELKGHVGPVMALRFTPNGENLISGGIDGSIVVWDVNAVAGDDNKIVVNGDEFKKLWADLAGEDGTKAYRSMVLLRRQPKAALPLIQAHIKPAKKFDEKALAVLFTRLEDEKQKTREDAATELEKIGDQVENELRKHAESDKCSEDARRRIQKILDRLENNQLTPDQLRSCRAVEILEQMGSAESRAILEDIAKGPESIRSTQEAKAALARLKK